jgi:threonine aldolase
MGGTLFGLWRGAASALSCLRRRLPLMPAYLDRAREIADAVRDLPGVTVVPDPPQTPMLHLLLRTGADEFRAAVRGLAAEGLWTWERAMPTGDPAVVRVELAIGDATLALNLEEIREAVAALAGPIPRPERVVDVDDPGGAVHSLGQEFHVGHPPS